MTFVLPSFARGEVEPSPARTKRSSKKPKTSKEVADKSKRGIALRARGIRDTLHGQPHEVRRKVRTLLEDVVAKNHFYDEDEYDDQETVG